MKKFASLALLFVAGATIATQGTIAPAVEKPAPAKDLLEMAQSKAAKENKSVMVIFHASWCGWCKRLDAWMATPQAKPFFDKEFVVVHLTVQESQGKEALENPGGMVYMTKWHGDKAGLPFTAILDSKGEMIVNSNSEKDGKEGNIGCPWAPEEQNWFFGMVGKARPNVSKSDLDALKTQLQAHIKEVEAKAKAGGGGGR